jgi:hypothetical protein
MGVPSKPFLQRDPTKRMLESMGGHFDVDKQARAAEIDKTMDKALDELKRLSELAK